MASKTTVTLVQRLQSALFYGLCSGLITIVNKLVLTSYGYVAHLPGVMPSRAILYHSGFHHFNFSRLDR